MRSWLLLLLPVVLLVAGCDSNRYFEEYKPIKGEAWSMANKQLFEVDIADTNAVFSLFFNVRHTSSYRYRNMFVFLETTFPDGQQFRDTLECMMADASGKWYGSGSEIKDHRFLFKRHVAFSQAGTYLFEFEQAMREDPLEHVKDVGLRIEKEG